jgi:hypothetical protein
MMRATGFLLGALLMLAVFLLILGTGSTSIPVNEPGSSKAIPPAVDNGLVEGMRDDSRNEGELLPAIGSGPLDKTSTPDAKDDGLKLEPQSWNQAMGAYQSVLPGDATEESRYRVWSPFRSQWAAQGFARRLTLATDVPMEVVSEGPGNYQVIFNYRDDGERQAMVRQIETITGLELE